MKRRTLQRALAASILLAVENLGAQPEAPYWKTFTIAPIGRWNAATVADLRDRLLQGTAEPRYVRLAACEVTSFFLQSTQGNYYDYVYEPGTPPDDPSDERGWELDRMMKVAIATDIPMGSHVNGMPWGDSTTQSLDVLHNYLEKYDAGDGPGSFLQRDRQGRIRTGTSTNPAADERTDMLGALEMQLTLSPYATLLRSYWERNLRQAVRLAQYQRDLRPDLVVFLSGSSEVGFDIHANVDFCDYSRWSAAEFRDWLLGTGPYAGAPQYANLQALNRAFGTTSPGSGPVPAGFPHTTTTFASMTPPILTDGVAPRLNPNTRRGRWFLKWHQFRVHQVSAVVALQGQISVECGWNPDRVFGHQVPDKVIPTDGSPIPDVGSFAAMFGAPRTTTFAPLMGNGITTYQDSTDSALFAEMRANDREWGIFEFNPVTLTDGVITPGSIDLARTAMQAVRTNQAHIISPYLWDGGLTGALAPYTIRTRPAEQALREFITTYGNSPLAHASAWEVNPESRSHIWRMRGFTELTAISGVSGLSANAGIISGTTTVSVPRVGLTLPAEGIEAIQYGELGARVRSVGATSGAFLWTDTDGVQRQQAFALQPGWNVVRMNLAQATGWQQGAIQALALQPASASGIAFDIDWVKLTPTFCWPMNDPGEISGTSGFATTSFAGGELVATSAADDAYFFLSTDKPAWTDADRVVIDADRYRVLEVEINASAATSGQLFWWRRGSTFQSSATIPITAGTQRLRVSLDAEAEWRGMVTQLRFDPVANAGVQVRISTVRVVEPLLAPLPAVDDVVINTEFPRLVWFVPVETEPLTSELEIARDFQFSTVVVRRTGLATTAYTHDGAPRLANGDHWWRVRSRGTTSQSASAWSVPMPIHLKKWTFDDVRDLYDASAPQIFRPSDITSPTVLSGILSATATNTNGDGVIAPSFHFNTGGDRGRGVNADIYTRLRLRFRMTGGLGGNGIPLVFFYSEETRNYYRIVLPSVPIDGVWRTLEVNMASVAEWRGSIKQVRFDPSFERGSYTFQLDWAELAPAGAPVLGSTVDPSGWATY